MKIQILIASHKSTSIPTDSSMYLPLQVGAEGKEPLSVLTDHPVEDPSSQYCPEVTFRRDNTGDQISAKNPYYCELTGAYWAWKNLDSDLVGLVHYRRYFSVEPKSYLKTHAWQDSVLTESELRSILRSYADALYGSSASKGDENAMKQLLSNGLLIVPRKRKYYIETLYSHYSHTLDGRHLDLCRQIIAERMPEYLDDFDCVMKQTWGYMWNMMIASRPVYDRYMSWLFSVLEELEKRIDLKGLSSFEQRLFGRVSEILFNVWLHHEMGGKNRQKSDRNQGTSGVSDASGDSNPGLLLLEFPVLHTQPENWPRKIRSFLAAKLFGKKYKASF
ncbi:MAG: DUF4422 domain-containing protein [Lachnospiraceae bacterium]|nr:DUF4422 domain-containing protein [Lachnospiraceae bacterium]